MPKPMVPVAGVPLMEHVIGNFVAAGITSLAIIVNEETGDCGTWVRARFPHLDVRVLVKTTGSSLESFEEIVRRVDGPRTVISTVDAWCPPEDFVDFVEAARRFPDEATVLAVTPLVADERPLWVSLAPDDRVTRLGGDAGAVVSAGVYVVPERVRRMAVPRGLGRLREFLAWLVERGEPVFGVRMPTVVDVDCAEDVALAEALARAGVLPVVEPKGRRR